MTKHTAPEADELVSYDVTDHVATLTLNRPKALNALTNDMKTALLHALERARDDADVRAVVLTGNGRAFCVGQDLREHVDQLATSDDKPLTTVRDHYNPIARTLWDLPKPTIAALNGVTAGAGLSLAMLCDLRLAAASATFTTAFSGIALSCDTGSSWTLQRLVGPTKAMELLFDPTSISAVDAERIGLVTSVVADDEFSETVTARASGLAAGPTLAYAAIRASVHYSAAHNLADSLDYEADRMSETGASADHRIAVDAFLAKQRPTFTGR